METLCENCGEVANFCLDCAGFVSFFFFIFGIFFVFGMNVLWDGFCWIMDRVAVVYRGAVARKEYYELKLAQEKATQPTPEKEAP